MNFLLAAAVSANLIVIDIDNFTADRGISTLILKITNNNSEGINSLFIDCTFMDENERAIDIGKSHVTNIRAGETVYDKASIGTTEGVQKALCRVKSIF